ncbi:MAG: translation initiation factor IF-2 [Verrucomicrobiae bacterium]|nr:translation initiation factor IF-2 [Verrucomicrobiae bacterium]
MPVRIYDIARKLGLESKVVIAKAKELGITNAKVASSTLDKITAEYLLDRLGPPPGESPPETPVESPATAPPEPAPVPEPVVPPTVAAIPEAAPPAGETIPSSTVETPAADTRPDGHEAQLEAAATREGADITAERSVGEVPAVEAPVPDQSAPVAAAEGPARVEATADAGTDEAAVEQEPAVPAVATEAAAPAATTEAGVPVVEPEPVAAVTGTPASTPEPVASEAPPAPPPPPARPAPRVPGLGELVGRIELPQRARPAVRPAPPPPPPRRPEPPRGGGGRPGAPGGFSRPGGPPTGVGAGRPGAASSAARGPAAGPGGANKGPALPDFVAPAGGKLITLKPPIIVRDLADRMGIKAYRLLHDLMELGVFANLNQAIDEKVAQFIAARHGFRFEVERREKGAGQVHTPVKKIAPDVEEKPEDLKSRPPVITIMGHVDHGKTTLLDVIRKSNVAARETGGITQHIGAYTIQVPHPERPSELQQLTFLDTPGHAAFSAMRARGANVTDIVILVVAASEGIMPQTVEALNHAKAAKVPIMVAVNKCDLPAANPLRVRQQLQEHGLVPEEWGGETIYVDVSASTKAGVDQLLSMLVLQSEVMELKANPKRRAKGNVIESGLEPGGPTATVLVRKGTLKLGDAILCGHYYGRTRALISEEGQRLKEAGPSVAVKVLGLNGVPEAGIEFTVVENERVARQLAEEAELEAKALGRERGPRVTLENLMKAIEQQTAKMLRIVIKGDTQGSVEAIVEALKKNQSPKVGLEIVHSAVGTISESDVILAASSKGIVVGFHTRLDNGVPAAAKREGVQIKQYAIIYELIDEVRMAMAGLLDPELKEVTLGTAEVRQIFELSKGGSVAGCMVVNGRIVKGKARVVRRKEVIHDGVLQTLRRYQDEVSEVRSGMECGIRVSSFEEFQVGDLIESYTVEKVPQQL